MKPLYPDLWRHLVRGSLVEMIGFFPERIVAAAGGLKPLASSDQADHVG